MQTLVGRKEEQSILNQLHISHWKNINNMGRPVIFLILFSAFNSCNFGHTFSNIKPQSLYRQRIPDSRLVIYDFSYAGAFATTSDYKGYAVLDSATPFSADKIKQLPCTYFSKPPMKSNFNMIHLDRSRRKPADTLLVPIGRYTSQTNDVQIEVVEYNDTYGNASMSTGQMEYAFDSVKESRDSLTFYNITTKSGGNPLSSIPSFAKGNIKIIDAADTIIRIEIEQLIIGRGSIYKPTAPLLLVPDQPIVGMATYYFHPKKTIRMNALSDYGIFKRII
ncbi:hypothetical protein Q4E93_31645 [Flavitalea sp. BT771]|uniref:hypothetical protein n=1 Tax=Flavitalea sp. BT771 TaxID=3063329 RepID=UPI0026E25DD4|nr:hypothetical protein [Flavitalea sp. BT771]MDO6435213.1 hypothetical protein [Flavitalea sp. BT771]MDV6224082.1 hypothetical protein [Flavitalea sp. BT771]